MKTSIHPTYHGNVIATCACGAKFELSSTLPEIHTEICSACHPFYTGKSKIIDAAGQVDKSRARLQRTEDAKQAKLKKTQEQESPELTATKAKPAKKASKTK